ncbi:SixA phosphatase family protein [Flavobacterium sp.]|uniref:SixA phosphatase family protein n=1 Tax=Flavobacterium sp. TaxID=239 RepID=UPI0038FCCAC9
MKNLILIRHGKSSWDLPVKDIDRSINQRGISDAHLVSYNCIKLLPSQFVIWSSIAKRATETALIFAKNINYPLENIIFKDDLYTFDENQLENVIKSCNNSVENIILFGHNEAITNFVNKFGNVFIDNVPTSGFVSLQFDTDDWNNIRKGVTKKTLFPENLK